MMQCEATTKAGKQCRKKARPGSDRCDTHLGVVKRSALTRELADQIVDLVCEGVPPEAGARALRVPASTFYDWLKEGRKAPGDEQTLAERIEEAKGTGELVLLRCLIDAGKKDWRAAWTVLKVFNPETYAVAPGAPSKPDAEVPDGGATDQAGL